MTLSRDERSSLEEELATAKSYADTLRSEAALMRKYAHGSAKDAYEETASYLMDLADDFEYAAPFQAMRIRLAEDEQADADQEAGQLRRAYEGSVL